MNLGRDDGGEEDLKEGELRTGEMEIRIPGKKKKRVRKASLLHKYLLSTR